MNHKHLLARLAGSVLPLLVVFAAAHAQKTSMPPKSEDRPLKDRIASMERAERDAWQKPDEVVKALN
jgi:hypothetical protein